MYVNVLGCSLIPTVINSTVDDCFLFCLFFSIWHEPLHCCSRNLWHTVYHVKGEVCAFVCLGLCIFDKEKKKARYRERDRSDRDWTDSRRAEMEEWSYHCNNVTLGRLEFKSWQLHCFEIKGTDTIDTNIIQYTVGKCMMEAVEPRTC